ncbi:MAG: hypothetical protein ACOC7W_09935 [Desulfosalsimonas sp.]
MQDDTRDIEAVFASLKGAGIETTEIKPIHGVQGFSMFMTPRGTV